MTETEMEALLKVQSIKKVAMDILQRAEKICDGDPALGITALIAAVTGMAVSMEIPKKEFQQQLGAVYDAVKLERELSQK